MSIKKEFLSFFHKISTFQGFSTFFILFVAAALFVPRFSVTANLINIFRQGSLILSFSIGMTIAMILGGLDLSIGAVAALSAVYAANFIKDGNIVAGVLIALGIGLVCGTVSGSIIAAFKLPHFIMTYGMMQIANGLTLNYTKGESIYGFPEAFRWLGVGFISFIPTPVIVSLLLLIIALFVTYRTTLGRSIYAVGDSKMAALFSGIPVGRTTIYSYALSGLFSGIAGLILIARLGSAEGIMGIDWPLQAIAASVLGGTSFAGGEGSVLATAFGALSVAIIYNSLNLLGVASSWQHFVIGFVIVTAVTFDYIRHKISERGKARKNI